MATIEYGFSDRTVRCTAGPGEDGKWRGHVVLVDADGSETPSPEEAPGSFDDEDDAAVAASRWAKDRYPPTGPGAG